MTLNIKPLGCSENELNAWRKMGISYDKRTAKQMVAAFNKISGALPESINHFEKVLKIEVVHFVCITICNFLINYFINVMKKILSQIISYMVLIPFRKIAPTLFLFLLNSSIMANTTNNNTQKTETTVTVNSLRPRLVRLEVTEAIPDDFKQLAERSEFYGKTFGWYLHEGDLVVYGDLEVDLPLLVRGHLVVTGDMSTKVYHEMPVLVSGDVIAQSISIYGGWLNNGGNMVTKAVILEDHDSARSFIGSNGLIYTELLSTYGDSCQATKIVETAIQLPIWNDYQNLHLLAPEFARHLPQGTPNFDEFSDDWEEWKENDKGQALFKELLSALKENRSIRNENVALSAPSEVRSWQQDITNTELEALSEEKDHLASRIALRPWPLSQRLQEILSRHDSVEVRMALAQRRDLIDSIQLKLCNDSDEKVKAQLAQNYSSCAQSLGASSPFETRLVYAQSQTALDHTAVAILVADPDTRIRLALSSHDWLDSVSLQTLMFDDKDIAVRRNAVRTGFRSGKIGPEKFLRLIADTDEKIRNIAVQTKIWRKDKRFDRRFGVENMLKSPYPIVRSAGASGFIEWPDIASEMAQHADLDLRKAAATSMFTPPQFLHTLSQESNFEIRASLARNFLTPTDVLDRLVDRELKSWRSSGSNFNYNSNKDKKKWQSDIKNLLNRFGISSLNDIDKIPLSDIEDLLEPPAISMPNDDDEKWLSYIKELIKHPSISPEALHRMQQAGIPYFSDELLKEQANWPADIVIVYGFLSVKDFADDNETPVVNRIKEEADRQRMLGWPDPEKILVMMLESNIPDLHVLAATSRFTPPEALRRYVQRHGDDEMYEDVMESIARNPATPEDILLTWVNQNRNIRNMLENPNLPFTVLSKIADFPISIKEEQILTSQADDEVEQMPTIVFGKERSKYTEHARILLNARKLRNK